MMMKMRCVHSSTLIGDPSYDRLLEIPSDPKKRKEQDLRDPQQPHKF